MICPAHPPAMRGSAAPHAGQPVFRTAEAGSSHALLNRLRQARPRQAERGADAVEIPGRVRPVQTARSWDQRPPPHAEGHPRRDTLWLWSGQDPGGSENPRAGSPRIRQLTPCPSGPRYPREAENSRLRWARQRAGLSEGRIGYPAAGLVARDMFF